MAKENSLSEIKRVHNKLIKILIEGHVGHIPNTKTFNRWKGGFDNYCDETTQQECSVRENFKYLEETRQISPGNYAVLIDIFEGDQNAIDKIEKAVNEIKIISTKGSSDSGKRPIQVADSSAVYGNKTEFEVMNNRSKPRQPQATNGMPLAKIVVPITKEQHDIGIKLAVIFGEFIKKLNLPDMTMPKMSTIKQAYEIVHGRGDSRSDLGESLKCAQTRLIENLRNVSTDNIVEKVASIFMIWFGLLHYLEDEYHLFVHRVGWDDSIVIVVKTGTSIEKNPWTSEVEAHMRDIFLRIGQDGVVAKVSVENLKTTAAQQLFDKFDRVKI